MTLSRSALSARAALALATHLLPAPVRVGDTRLFAAGRLHLWPRWKTLPPEDRDRVCRFLGQRPDTFADDNVLAEELLSVLDAADDFALVEDPEPADQGRPWDRRFQVAPGRPLTDRLDDWLSELLKTRQRTGRAGLTRSDGDLSLVAGDLRFRVPQDHIDADGPAPLPLLTTSSPGGLSVDLTELRELARRIDRVLPTGPRYEEVAIQGLAQRLLDENGARVTSFADDRTSLLVAPTGTGKSVFARLIALALAQRHIPVALVVPDIPLVWREAQRLEQIVSALGESVQVVPLSSWRSLPRHLIDYVEHNPPNPSTDAWGLKNAGSACLLAAYSEVEHQAPEPGEEPCTRLRQRLTNGKEQAVVCPFARSCGRFTAFRACADGRYSSGKPPLVPRGTIATHLCAR